MRKEIINHLIFYLGYFLFILLINRLFSFTYWPLYLGGLLGVAFSYIDHILHVLIYNPQELTSLRVQILLRSRSYKEAIMLLHQTADERKNLIFHTVYFQVIFTILTFWVVSSSGGYFGRGLVLGYFLSLTIYNLKKFVNKELIFGDLDQSRIYFAVQVILLFVFGILI